MSLEAAPLVPITGAALAERAAAVRDEVGKAFIGQAEVLDQMIDAAGCSERLQVAVAGNICGGNAQRNAAAGLRPPPLPPV